MEKNSHNCWVIQNQSLLLYSFILFFSLPLLQFHESTDKQSEWEGCLVALQSPLDDTVGSCIWKAHHRLFRSTSWLWGQGRGKKETAAWRVFGHFANVTLQGGICNCIPGEKHSGSTVPQALGETEHLVWMWGCQRKCQDEEYRGIKPDDDNHAGQS